MLKRPVMRPDDRPSHGMDDGADGGEHVFVYYYVFKCNRCGHNHDLIHSIV